MAKIAIGNAAEAYQPETLQALVVEFIVTFLFVFAGVGSAMATSEFSHLPFLSTNKFNLPKMKCTSIDNLFCH